MAIFISYNHPALETARALESALQRCGIESWWFSDLVKPEQVDEMVHRALQNCDRCAVIWSQAELSQWQWAEIITIHKMWDRSDRFFDAFFVLRNLDDPGIREKKTLPFLLHTEYIDYRASDRTLDLDLGFLREVSPGVTPLRAGPGRRPRFGPPPFSQGLAGGRYVVIGGFETPAVSQPEPVPEPGFCWVLLRDVYDNVYLQNPRPFLTHRDRWIARNVNVGGGDVCDVLLLACGPESHRCFVKAVLAERWSGFRMKDVPPDFIELDRLEVPASSRRLAESPVGRVQDHGRRLDLD